MNVLASLDILEMDSTVPVSVVQIFKDSCLALFLLNIRRRVCVVIDGGAHVFLSNLSS